MRGWSRWYKKWLKPMSTPASTPQYKRGAVSKVRASVTPAMAASVREMRHSRTNACGLSRPTTAVSTMAANTACGTWRNTGKKNSKDNSTTMTDASVAHPVFAPAKMFSAERAKDELVGNAPLKPDAIFPSP